MLQWEPTERYDVVYFGDMLGVAHDRVAVLERVHRWLLPGGAMTITDIVAGSDLNDEDRAFIWGEDGFEVPLQADSLAQIRNAGFTELDVLDQTLKVVTMQETILQASYRHKTTLVDTVGEDSWLEWVETAKHYGRLFAEGKLLSLRIGTHRT